MPLVSFILIALLRRHRLQRLHVFCYLTLFGFDFEYGLLMIDVLGLRKQVWIISRLQ